ncbi:MAG TPA: 2-dehydropantoate 2-reductase [Candidatus Omnitrophica bacterium]|nr:2-dehydropantoate 2-reductase [Candidatus Omnitrophota bacterium]
MKITIVGPGAMGCLLACFLSKSKEEIWLLDKNPERAQKIKEQGLKIEGISGSWQVKVNIAAQAKEIAQPQDLVIIAVKSYDTKNAVKDIKSLLSETSLVLSLQNGLGNIEIISEVVGQERVLGGITNQGATLLGPGWVRHAGKAETVIGRLDGRLPVELRFIRELFNQCGLETRLSKDIKSLLWSKLIINVGINALTALTHLHNGKLIEFAGTRKILEEAVNEAVRVAKKKRIKLIYDDPLSKVEAVCEATAANVSSMLQDVLRRKPTEIDFINGAIVRQAQALNLPTPVNSVLTNLVKTIEASYNLRVNL